MYCGIHAIRTVSVAASISPTLLHENAVPTKHNWPGAGPEILQGGTCTETKNEIALKCQEPSPVHMQVSTYLNTEW